MDGEHDAGQVTRLLQSAAAGDDAARGRLVEILYDQLRSLAERQMHGLAAGGHTLQPTALVHEAWLKLAGNENEFASRGHFLGVASRAMRSVVVDHVRARRAAKRGGGQARTALDDVVAFLEAGDTDLLDLHAALQELELDDPELGRLVELRFFGGLGHAEIADALGCSPSTVDRGWRVARARLHRRLAPGEPNES